MVDTTRVLAELSVPRYTSYPTAPHFSSAVGPAEYATWIEAIPATAALSLYIHVPYCVALCSYCGCNTKAVRRPEPLAAYVEQLLREIALVGAAAGGGKVVHLHWGGGTPSIVGPALLVEIYAALRELFDFAADHDHAIELDPRYIDRALVQALADIEIDRVSLGVQEFAPHIQQAIGRIQPFSMVERSVALLREFGIEQINFDLMYGLPGQTVDDIRRSVALAASLDPQRLAIFGYAHVPWLRKHQSLIDDAALPGAVARWEQAEAAREHLVALGYQAIGLDHFARPGDSLAAAARTGGLHRNFQGYTTDDADALIGLGASAIGRLRQGFVQNAPDVGGYGRAVESGRFATVKGLALTADDRVRARVIERIMCDFSVDLDEVAPGVEFGPELASLDSYESEGLVRLAGERIDITDKGRPLVRLIAAAFDAYLANARARHSVAV